VAAGQAPASPGLDSPTDGNWTQECTDRSLDQDHRQDNEQSPLQKAAMDEESKTLVIPQLYPANYVYHRITESQNSRGWKGPLWVI